MDELARRHLQAVDNFIITDTSTTGIGKGWCPPRRPVHPSPAEFGRGGEPHHTPRTDASTSNRIYKAVSRGGKQRALSEGIPERLGRGR